MPRKEGGAADGNPGADYYVVRGGDTLERIAMKCYGDETLGRSIFIANRHILPDPRHIEPGQKLLLP